MSVFRLPSRKQTTLINDNDNGNDNDNDDDNDNDNDNDVSALSR